MPASGRVTTSRTTMTKTPTAFAQRGILVGVSESGEGELLVIFAPTNVMRECQFPRVLHLSFLAHWIRPIKICACGCELASENALDHSYVVLKPSFYLDSSSHPDSSGSLSISHSSRDSK